LGPAAGKSREIAWAEPAPALFPAFRKRKKNKITKRKKKRKEMGFSETPVDATSLAANV